MDNVLSSFLPYPAMTSGISYGVGEFVNETESDSRPAPRRPISHRRIVRWARHGRSPVSTTLPGPRVRLGLGYSVANGFATTLYKANTGSVANLAQADAVINTPSDESSVTSETESVLNFMDTGGGGHFGSDNPFPGMTVGRGAERLCVDGHRHDHHSHVGLLHVRRQFRRRFFDDRRAARASSTARTRRRSAARRWPATSCKGRPTRSERHISPRARYTINLTYYQNAGGAEFELFDAASTPAAVTSFNSNFQLIGDTATGGLAVTSVPFARQRQHSTSPIAAAIQTNVKSTVQAPIQTAGTTSLYSRITFAASDLASLSSLTLRMQFDSGYVAYLNGVEVASSNAPASPAWNSQAT